jgi:hypothetical protein
VSVELLSANPQQIPDLSGIQRPGVSVLFELGNTPDYRIG